MILVIRKGAARGNGRGYKNLRNFPKDPIVHAQAAKGIKQPQRMNVIPRFTGGKDTPTYDISKSGIYVIPQSRKDEGVLKDDFLTKVAEKQEKKPSKVISALSKAGSAAVAFGTKQYKAYQESSRQRAKERRETHIEELRDVEHPLVKKRDRIEQNISKIEDRIASGIGDEDKHFEELETLKEELRDVEEKIENVDLSTFTDPQLKSLAVRHTDDGFLSIGGGNKYESELLRRIEYRKQLDNKVREAHKTKKEGSGDLFDF